MWKFQANYKYGEISLHDCRITSIAESNGDIILNFEDGYWVTTTNPQNPYGKVLRTDASRLVLVGGSCEDVIFNGKKFLWDEFCSKINSGKWSYECITECYTDTKIVYHGWVWERKRSHQPDPECQIWLTYQSLIYNWNKIREDRQW